MVGVEACADLLFSSMPAVLGFGFWQIDLYTHFKLYITVPMIGDKIMHRKEKALAQARKHASANAQAQAESFECGMK